MKYLVKVKRVEIYYVEVDATSKEVAEIRADLMVDTNPQNYLNDRDVEFTVDEV